MIIGNVDKLNSIRFRNTNDKLLIQIIIIKNRMLKSKMMTICYPCLNRP